MQMTLALWMGRLVLALVLVLILTLRHPTTRTQRTRRRHPHRNLLNDINLPRTPIRLSTPIIAQPQPGIIRRVDRQAINIRLQVRDSLTQNGHHGRDQDRRDAGIDEQLALGAGTLGVAEPGAVIAVADGGVGARDELVVDVETHGRGVDRLAYFGVVEARVAGERGGGVAGVDAAEAAADEAQEGAGHAGEEDDEGEGGGCFDWWI